MSRKILILLLVTTFAMTMLFAGGSKETAETKTKTQVTIMVDHDFRIDDVGLFLAEKYPDVDFDIQLGRGGVAFLQKAAENGYLPDIIISSNAWGRYGVELNSYLYDLSATDIASEFYTVYLDNYTTPEGKIHWLPGCAAIEGVMANKELFDKYGIELPTDYASFVEVCNRFSELGIRPYASDYKYDYTCAYLLQSWSIPLLQSKDAKSWRISFEGGEVDTLDETIGLQMFEKLQSFFELTGVTSADAKRGYGNTFSDFFNGNVAMIRQSTNNSSYYESGMKDLVILPYFGETEADGWYFTTPSYAVAMSGSLKGDSREDLCLDIIRSLFSQECMNIFASRVQAFTTYSKGITFEVQEQFQNIIPYVESNHMYTYLSLDNVTAASKASVQAMIKGEATPAQALAIFNEEVVKTPAEKPVITTIDVEYSRKWTSEGNKALSAVLNTINQFAECDILFGPSTISASTVYKGSYNQTELDNLIYGGGLNIYRKELTGKQIRDFASVLVSGGVTSYDAISLSTLPGVVGAKMVVKQVGDNQFQLEDLLVNGESIRDDAKYYFGFVDNSSAYLTAAFSWVNEEHNGQGVAVSEGATDIDFSTYEGFPYVAKHVADLWLSYFQDGGKIQAPTDYIQVK